MNRIKTKKLENISKKHTSGSEWTWVIPFLKSKSQRKTLIMPVLIEILCHGWPRIRMYIPA